MNRVYAVDLGRMDYLEVLEIQEKLERKVALGREAGYLLISESDPVITVGRASEEDEVIYSKETLKAMGIKRYSVERGGRVTLHGPGQIVGYPIINLENYKKDLHWYLSSLEEVVGEALDEIGVENHRVPGKTGVWTEAGKICAIGVKVRRWATTHGFALNHTIDLDLFKGINPCGLMEYGVARIEDYRSRVERKAVIDALCRSFQRRFQCELIIGRAKDLL